MQELGNSLEALRAWRFRPPPAVAAADERGELGAWSNRMAEALAEFRRSNLGKVLRDKEALRATIAALPDAVFVVQPDGEIVARNPLARAVLREFDAEEANFISHLPFPAALLPAGPGRVPR